MSISKKELLNRVAVLVESIKTSKLVKEVEQFHNEAHAYITFSTINKQARLTLNERTDLAGAIDAAMGTRLKQLDVTTAEQGHA